MECLAQFVHEADGIGIDVEAGADVQGLGVDAQVAVARASGDVDVIAVEDAHVAHGGAGGCLFREAEVILAVLQQFAAVGLAWLEDRVGLEAGLQVDAEERAFFHGITPFFIC